MTPIPNGSFLTVAEGAAGLKFTPAPDFAGAATFQVQSSLGATDAGLPYLLLLLDRFEGFLAAFENVDGGMLVDALLRLLREGPSVGLRVMFGNPNGYPGAQYENYFWQLSLPPFHLPVMPPPLRPRRDRAASECDP